MYFNTVELIIDITVDCTVNNKQQNNRPDQFV